MDLHKELLFIALKEATNKNNIIIRTQIIKLYSQQSSICQFQQMDFTE